MSKTLQRQIYELTRDYMLKNPDSAETGQTLRNVSKVLLDLTYLHQRYQQKDWSCGFQQIDAELTRAEGSSTTGLYYAKSEE